MNYFLKRKTVISLFSVSLLSALTLPLIAAPFLTGELTSNITNEMTSTVAKSASGTTTVETNASAKTKQQLMEKLNKISFFSADFTQEVLDINGNILQKANGTLAVNKPDLVNWHTITPEESLFVSDGKTLWFYDPFVEQVTAYSLNNALTNTPILLLTSTDKSLWDNYSVSSPQANNYLIHANKKNSQIKTLELRFSVKMPNELVSFTLLDATGQLSVFNLDNSDYKNQPDGKLFDFLLPKGVYLDDQR
jgi:outer membrane lipoprotein carrier protein